MRILILSANTGGGHNSTALAIAEQLQTQGVQAEIDDALSYISEKVSHFVSWGHSYVYRKMPRLFNAGYRFEEKHPPRFIYNRCAKGTERLARRLEEGFDAVICTHAFAGMMLTALRQQGATTPPAYFVATDYTCSPGVADLAMDGFFIPHESLKSEFMERGVKPERLHATGIPIAAAFYEKKDRLTARRALSLPTNGRIVLLGCGSMGAGRLDRSALELLKTLPMDTMLVVLCGNNQAAYHALQPYVGERLRALPFTDRVPDYMSAADLYITKPGGLTITEAVIRRLPMVYINAVPGLETRNFDFMIQSGVACGADKWCEVTALVQQVLQDPAAMEAQLACMEQFPQANAAAAISRIVIEQMK